MLEEDITATIFRKLFVMKKIGAAHTPVENIQKGFPKHARGDANKIIPKLVKKSWLLMRRHVYGFGVSLNPERLEDIKNIIKRHFPEYFKDI